MGKSGYFCPRRRYFQSSALFSNSSRLQWWSHSAIFMSVDFWEIDVSKSWVLDLGTPRSRTLRSEDTTKPIGKQAAPLFSPRVLHQCSCSIIIIFLRFTDQVFFDSTMVGSLASRNLHSWWGNLCPSPFAPSRFFSISFDYTLTFRFLPS